MLCYNELMLPSRESIVHFGSKSIDNLFYNEVSERVITLTVPRHINPGHRRVSLSGQNGAFSKQPANIIWAPWGSGVIRTTPACGYNIIVIEPGLLPSLIVRPPVEAL